MSIDNNEEAPEQFSPDPRLHQTEDNYNLQSNHSTSSPKVNPRVEDPQSAESRALRMLKKAGYKNIQQLDWIAQNTDGNWVAIEIKDKELFEPGTNYPHWGAGLDRTQLYLRTQLFDSLRCSTKLIHFEKGTNTYYEAFLEDLESSGDYYDTPRGIRIYPIEHFSKGEYHED